MGFQKIVVSRGSGRGGNRKVDTPQISFYQNVGGFRFNRAALDALGNPEKVAVLHDPDTNRIAVVADEEGVTFRQPDKSGSRMLAYGSFASIAEAAQSGVAKIRGTLVQDSESGYWVSDMLTEAQNVPAASANDATNAEAADTDAEAAAEPATTSRRR